MEGVTVVDHVLLRRLVSILRDRGTPHGVFRQTLDDAAMILAYEAMRGLRHDEYEVQTPLEGAVGTRLADEIVLVAILRAGLGLVDGFLRLVPDALFARAMSVVLTGVSLATVCAAPVGAWMGELWGWRSAFTAAAVLSTLTLAAQLAALPPMPPRDRPDVRVLADLVEPALGLLKEVRRAWRQAAWELPGNDPRGWAI